MKKSTGNVPIAARPTRKTSALAKAKEQLAVQKFQYYQTNRSTLPSDIREHSEAITRMMENGMSVELAFKEAAKLCYPN